MKVFKGIVTLVATVALAVTFVGAGLGACLLPPVTHALSSLFAQDGLSPYDRSQLVEVADATRDYSFGSHDEAGLYRVIYQVASDYRAKVEASGGTVPADFPKPDAVSNLTSTVQLKAVFSSASELYCFSPETVSHLDDCYALFSVAWPLLVVALAVAFVGLVFLGVTCRKRRVAGVLMAAGILVLVAFAALAAFAIVDFDGFFAAFHQLFFSQGNWTFPYDSLLICALPTPFWMGMGVVWLAVALVVSVLSIVIGNKVRK